MSRTSLCVSLAVVLMVWAPAQADVELPSIFSDHAVFQAETAVPIWGWASPGETVKVVVAPENAFKDLKATKLVQTTKADANGKWMVRVGPFRAGTKIAGVVVTGKNKVQFTDVLVGEVWLCSGQSNMAWTVARSDDFDKEKANANYPEIRMFKVANNPQTTPQEKVKGQWLVCSPETVGGFSATAYFFGRKLHKDLKVPVGLINSSVGGTAIESWTSMPVQKSNKDLQPVLSVWDEKAKDFDLEKATKVYEKRLAQWKKAAKAAKDAGKKVPRRPQAPVHPRTDRNHPSNLFNGMIAPLVPYAVRGAIWYQGENNANRDLSHLYGKQLATMIEDWRERWNAPEMSFYWVQLPNFKKRVDAPIQESGWANVREGMRQTLSIPHTGMAVTIDIGNPSDIHPANKQDYGLRLAKVALANTYNKDIAAGGPSPKTQQFKSGKIVITFDHAKGLSLRKAPTTGFAVAGKDGTWHHAQAMVKGDQVVLWSEEVMQPVEVRYLWADNPEATLYNSAGLPASPFRITR